MSVSEFSATIQSKVYKDWLTKLETNIINTSAKNLRSSQEVAAKTDFLITRQTLVDMFEKLSGSKADSHNIDLMMNDLQGRLGGPKGAQAGKAISVNGRPAVLFENIGFDTISKVMDRVLDSPEVHEHLHDLSLQKQAENVSALQASGQKISREAFRKADTEKVTLGSFFHKGHVVGVATNLTKQFITEVEASDFAAGIKKQLISVLQQYVDKLQEEDLATANLPNAVTQEIYAKYTKSPTKYLVEFQVGTENQLSGSEARPVIQELRRLFSGAENTAIKELLTGNSVLGRALITTEGSPSYTNLIARGIANTIVGKKQPTTRYSIPKTKVMETTAKITKPVNNSAKIQAANKLITALKKPTPPKKILPGVSLANLISLLRSKLALQIKENMGTGGSTNVLNYRTGRFAESASIERATISREGMVSVFYNYMRQPYGTFSEGGQQQYPRSRDPKTLIAKSIRDIGASAAYTRMRAILV